jgi:hypothetical protein
VELLERGGTPEARKVPEALAKLTKEATASLERWPAP